MSNLKELGLTDIQISGLKDGFNSDNVPIVFFSNLWLTFKVFPDKEKILNLEVTRQKFFEKLLDPLAEVFAYNPNDEHFYFALHQDDINRSFSIKFKIGKFFLLDTENILLHICLEVNNQLQICFAESIDTIRIVEEILEKSKAKLLDSEK